MQQSLPAPNVPAAGARNPLTHSTGRTRLLLLLLILGAFALRTSTLARQSLWRDEVDAIFMALRPLEQTLSMFTAMAQNGPLYFLTLRPWIQMAGSSEFALRYLSALAGVAAVPLLWQVARRITRGAPATVPALAALLLAINPYALWYSQEGKMYAIVMLLALAATWAWLCGIEGGNVGGGARTWIAYTLCMTLAMYYHLLAVLLIPLHMLWFAIAFPAARKRWRAYGLALAALTLPYLPLLVWQWAMLRAPDQVTGFGFTPLGEMLKTIFLNQTRGFMPGDPVWLLTPIFFAAALGLLLGWSELHGAPAGMYAGAPNPIPPLRRYGLLAAWLAAPILGIWLLSLRQPVFTDRYVAWTLPATLIFVALGVQVVRSSLGRAGAPLALLLAATICAVWLYTDFQQVRTTVKFDLRGAVHHVAARRAPESLLLLQIPHLEYAFRYYSGDQGAAPFAGSDARLGHWAGGLWTNGGADDATAAAEADAQMRSMTNADSDIWVMRSEVEMWDQRGLMGAWLAQHATLLEQADFHGVQVLHYQLQPNPIEPIYDPTLDEG